MKIFRVFFGSVVLLGEGIFWLVGLVLEGVLFVLTHTHMYLYKYTHTVEGL